MTGGTLTFQEPKVVTRFTNNDVYEDEYPVGTNDPDQRHCVSEGG